MKSPRARAALRCIAALTAAVLLLGAAQRLVTPKYVDDVIEGAFIAEYYREEKDFDVLFVGDCEVYENFSPPLLWEEFGINSYIRGSADQYIWQSYYLLEDTLRYETPDVVFFNVLALQYDVSQREEYNRMSLEGMRWSPSKVKAIQASMLEGEHFLDYVFPLLRYHARWSQLKATDFTYFFRVPTVTHNGFSLRVDVRPAGDVPVGKPLGDYSFGPRALEYLDKITDLCQERGVRLVLLKAPSLYPYWYPQWEEQVEEYAARRGLTYLNLLEEAEDIGIDYSTDTYDGGLHMNLSGAEKLTRRLGEFLTRDVGLPDRRGEARLSRRWEEKLAAYRADIAAQRAQYGITD